MMEVFALPFVLAMAQPGAGSPNLLVQLAPFALMLVIFYLLVLMPMKRKQKKVADFQSSLKVGDRVITTSGLYGQVTKLTDASAQIQIADKVRVEVARSSVGGYQGQEPVVSPESGGL
jgi:preprotein translocase subunit YajC